MKKQSKPTTIAAIIATCDRPALLNERALTSIAAQTEPPDVLVVVDDSPQDATRSRNRNIVNDLRIAGTQIVYLPNTRERGLSGALNTGIEYVARHRDIASTFVALLDDDDAWRPQHLAACREAASDGTLDVVATGLERRTSRRGSGRLQEAPTSVDIDTLLVGNPHIQGSNLFVRLETLLEAGLFDESLRSCTDRDVMVRLLEVGARYGRVPEVTVVHYAESDRPRLSEPSSPAKLDGLFMFWRKYRRRMTEEQRDAFAERAGRLFGWSPRNDLDVAASKPASLPGEDPDPAEDVHAEECVLVAAIISDDEHAARCDALLKDLGALLDTGAISGLDVVLLENGYVDGALCDVAAARRRDGLSIFYADMKQQHQDAESGVFGDMFVRSEGRAAIATARTMVQTYALRVAQHRPASVVWILDDDNRLDNDIAGLPGARAPVEALAAQLRELPRLKARQVSAVLGTVTAAPPVPFSSTVRVQLVDAVHNLEWLRRLPLEGTLPHDPAHNEPLRRWSDYYYDLSRRSTKQLEAPFALEPAREGETVSEAMKRFITTLPRMFAGEQLTRRLLHRPGVDLVAAAEPSVQRGSNTFVFDLDTLSRFPNPTLCFDGTVMRRSDMVWALLNRFAGGYRIVRSPIAVRQDRSSDAPNDLDLGRLIPDIRGYALYSALEDVLQRRRSHRLREGIGAEHPDDLQFDDGDLRFAEKRFEKYLVERTSAFALSFRRCRGLGRRLLGLADELGEQLPTDTDRDFEAAVLALTNFARRLVEQYDEAELQPIFETLEVPPQNAVRGFFEAIRAQVAGHSTAKVPARGDDRWFDVERERNALALLPELRGPARVLGKGTEAVVVTDGRSVFKVIDYAKTAFSHTRWEALLQLTSMDREPRRLYPLDAVEPRGGRLVIRYRYEPSQPYVSGHGADLVELLRECRALGVVMTNLHPKNVVVTRGGLRLIDYGADIRPYTDELFESMIQRAWLMWRYPTRTNLAELMREALHNPELPELRGWEKMRDAVTPPRKEELVDEPVRRMIVERAPRTVLDYGCGKGGLAASLSSSALVTAYDPDTSVRSRWRTPEVDWKTSREEATAATFDVVTCNLVLCVIEEDEAYRRVLEHLRRSTAPDGRLFLSVCHPDGTGSGHSALQHRDLPEGAEGTKRFVWKKTLSSGIVRRDVHRPWTMLRRDLESAGFEIVRTSSTGSRSLETFDATDEFLIVEARPRRGRGPGGGASDSTPPVLCYHRVLPSCQQSGVTAYHRRRGTVVDVQTFAKQMEDVRRRFTPIDLDTYLAGLAGARLPERACLVTFDDGYRDFASEALPVLQRLAIPSVLFPVQACAQPEPRLTPVDLLYAALAQDERGGRRLTDEQRTDWAFGPKKRALLAASPAERDALLDELADVVEADLAALNEAFAPELYLSESELAGLGSRVAIGAHGVTHALLTSLDDRTLVEELGASLRWVKGFERGVPVLAYPSGKHYPRVVAATSAAGFEAGFTVLPWRSEGLVESPYKLRRACVPNEVDAVHRLADGEEVSL